MGAWRILRSRFEDKHPLEDLSPESRIAVRGGHIVGIAAVTGDYLAYLWVHEDVRGQGIGSRLLQETRCSTLDCDRHLVPFYEARGFRIQSPSLNRVQMVREQHM